MKAIRHFAILRFALNWHSRQESHLQPPRSKRGALIIELREQIGRSRWYRAIRASLMMRSCSLELLRKF